MFVSRLCHAIRLILVALGLVWASSSQATVKIATQSPAEAGKAVSFSVETTGAGGYRLASEPPRIWLVAPDGDECVMPGPLSGRTEISGRRILILHADNTISAVNPDRSLASGNIAWMAKLEGPVRSWSVDQNRSLLHVTLASSGIVTTLRLEDGQHDSVDSAITQGALPLWLKLDAGDLAGPLNSGVSSNWAQLRFTFAGNGRAIIMVDAAEGNDRGTIALVAPADKLTLSPDERWLFALNGKRGTVQIVDIATRKLSRILEMHGGIGAISFSKDYLYMRERNAPFANMLRLSSLDDVKEHVFRIPVGLQPSSDALVPLGNDGMAFLNGAEQVVYLYMESGMADNHGNMRSPTEMLAPYAAVKIRGGKPVDMLVNDIGLRSISAGNYAGTIRPPYGGRWRIVARTARSGEIVCHDFNVNGAPARRAKAELRMQALPGGSSDSFLVTSENGIPEQSAPETIRLIAMQPGSNWHAAVVARRQGGSIYRVVGTLPVSGLVTLVSETRNAIIGSVELERNAK